MCYFLLGQNTQQGQLEEGRREGSLIKATNSKSNHEFSELLKDGRMEGKKKKKKKDDGGREGAKEGRKDQKWWWNKLVTSTEGMEIGRLLRLPSRWAQPN